MGALGRDHQENLGSALNKIEEKWGKVPLAVFNDKRMIEKVIAWRNSRRETPRTADNGITVLHALLKFGIHSGLLSTNVAARIGRLYVNGERAEIVWTEDDLNAFSIAAGEKDRYVEGAVLLGTVTRLRREDLARLTWSGVGKFAVAKKAAKKSRGRRRFATMPRVPELDVNLGPVGIHRELMTAAAR